MSTLVITPAQAIDYEIQDHVSDQIGLIVLMVFLAILGICMIVFIWVRQFGYASKTTQIWVTVAGSLLLLLVIALGIAYYRKRVSLERLKLIKEVIIVQ